MPAAKQDVSVVQNVVSVIPKWIRALIAGLGLVLLAVLAGLVTSARRTRRLRRQREDLRGDVGALQAALLPEVPSQLPGLSASVAYRPADGPAAGGDFYDVFRIDEKITAVIVGDLSGHGRQALERTALLRYTLRAYLNTGLAPRAVLQLAGQVLSQELKGDFATVVIATYDESTGTLSYAGAGHPPPIVAGAAEHHPCTPSGSPPLGMGFPTGLRQTTLTLPAGSVVCFYTDGLIEARRGGEMIDYEGLAEMVAELSPEATAETLLAQVAKEADETTDDMAVCLLHTAGEPAGPEVRVEEVELDAAQIERGAAEVFARTCGLSTDAVEEAGRAVRDLSDNGRQAVLRLHVENGGSRVESFAAAPPDARGRASLSPTAGSAS